MAEEFPISQAWVNRVLKTLEQEGIVQRGGVGRHASGTELLRPKELLRKWVQHYNFSQKPTYLYLIQKKDPVNHLKQVCQLTGGRYALTGYAAANKIKKIVHHAPPMAYHWLGTGSVTSDRSIYQALENQYGFIPVLKEANLILIHPVQSEIF
ncbi:MAG: helix-turn-helix domain-containing protein, partial [Kiloniellales bacterium]|nr:helix-turn-helix domain-containing protein [Kiloniellales bacterium]